MISFLQELWAFAKERKKYWLLPFILVLLLFGTLIVLTQGSAVAPFIYTLFWSRKEFNQECQTECVCIPSHDNYNWIFLGGVMTIVRCHGDLHGHGPTQFLYWIEVKCNEKESWILGMLSWSGRGSVRLYWVLWRTWAFRELLCDALEGTYGFAEPNHNSIGKIR